MIPTLCASLDELDEPEAKASLIWIIGEYANKIDNADELLGIFVDSFTEEAYPVRVPSTPFCSCAEAINPRYHRGIRHSKLLGSIANPDGCCQVGLDEARQCTRPSPKSIEYGN